MRRATVYVLAVVGLAAACNSGSGPAPDGSGAPALTLTIPSPLSARPPPTTPRERTGPVPPPASASAEEHVSALASLLERGKSQELPVEAADPGWSFDHDLRATLTRPGARRAAVQLEPPVASGIPPKIAETAWKAQLPRIRRCYERGLASNPSLSGRIAVGVMIDASGTVASSKKVESDVSDTAVVTCIVRLGESLTLPNGTPAGSLVLAAKLSAEP